MTFQRRILHHGPDPSGTPQLLSLNAVRSCWFELHRQGGCGAAQLVLSDTFEQRDEIELGDWISFEVEAGNRWYLGRVEERSAEVPAKIRYRLQGMSIELNQVFPGGFGQGADGFKPHRYAALNLFTDDPDYDRETFDFVGSADEVVRLLMTQYVTSATHIQYDPDLVEAPEFSAPVTSLKVRGEESVRSLLKDLSLRAQSASWGVDATGTFFFLQPRSTLLATFREQRDLVSLSETKDVEYLYNRLLLTGDYVYDRKLATEDVARRVYRWRGHFFEPNSRSLYGDRRLKIWLPWVRTQADSHAFAREFFRVYSRPQSRYQLETTGQNQLPLPWMGTVRLESRDGTKLIEARVETIRVLFDHIPRFRMELGPEDPRTLWPEPPQDERWELPHQEISAGGPVTQLPPLIPEGGGGGGNSNDGSDRFPSGDSSETDFSSEDFSSSASDGSDGSEGSTGELNSTSQGWPGWYSGSLSSSSRDESGSTESSGSSDSSSEESSSYHSSWGGGSLTITTSSELSSSSEDSSLSSSEASSSDSSLDDPSSSDAAEDTVIFDDR